MSSNRWTHCFCTGLVVAASLLTGSGCATQPPTEAAPDIPPESTFIIDFDDFSGGGAKLLDDPTARVVQAIPGGNWTGSVITIGVWNVIITITLAVPVAAFVESFNHEPTLLDDGTWEWAYDFVAGGVQHSAALQARAELSGIVWNMFITKDGEFADFNWFSGESNLTGTAGTWTLNLMPNDPKPFIFIEWNRDPTDATADIKYTNITPSVAENGGFIFYGITTETPFDAFYTIFSAEQDNTTDIEWNRTSKDGRVRDPRRFDDQDWHCWDTELQNADCPEAM